MATGLEGVTVIETSGYKIVDVVDVPTESPGLPGIVVSPDGVWAAATTYWGGSVHIIDIATLTVVNSIDMRYPYRTTGAVTIVPTPTRHVEVEVWGGGRVFSDEPGPQPRIDCPGICDEQVLPWFDVRLRAVASPGWHFDEWTGDCAGSSSFCSLEPTADHRVSAWFVRPIDLLDRLIAMVRQNVEDDVLLEGQGNSMIQKLENAKSAITNDRPSATNKVESFINEVEAYLNASNITVEDGQPLIDLAVIVVSLLEA